MLFADCLKVNRIMKKNLSVLVQMNEHLLTKQKTSHCVLKIKKGSD